MRLLFTSDLHGSNICWTKLCILAADVNADVVVVAGDLTGKDYATVEASNGTVEVRRNGGSAENVLSEDWATYQSHLKDKGYYLFPERNQEPSTAELDEASIRRLRQWIEHFGRQAPKPKLLLIPGNDDSSAVATFIETSGTGIDGTCVQVGEHEFAGLGYSNVTPYNTFRELTEVDLGAKLEQLLLRVRSPRQAVFVIHVPPFDTGLDLAPLVKSNTDGTFSTIRGRQGPVGSIAVREFVQEVQPLAVLSGHCHDSPGFARLGETLCANTGSAFQSGTLYAGLVILDKDRVSGHQSLLR